MLGDAIEGTALIQSLPGLLTPTTAYLVSITATILGFTAVNRLASSWSGIDWEESFTKFGLAYVPLGIMFTLGAHAIGGLLEDGGYTLERIRAWAGDSADPPCRCESRTRVGLGAVFRYRLAVACGALECADRLADRNDDDRLEATRTEGVRPAFRADGRQYVRRRHRSRDPRVAIRLPFFPPQMNHEHREENDMALKQQAFRESCQNR